MPTCKTCGKLIRFLKSTDGRFIPVEFHPVPFDLDWGFDSFYLPDGTEVGGKSISEADAISARRNGETLEIGYVAHRQFCQKARKKGNNKK